MARVVQQRSGPPYLLIVFVFLFLLSATMAVLFYVRYDKALKDKNDIEKANSALATPEQLKELRGMAAMMETYRKSQNKPDDTVVRQFAGQIDRLTESIMGRPTDPTATLARVEQVYAKTQQRGGLADQVDSLMAKVKEEGEAKDKTAVDLRSRDKEISSLKEQEESTLSALRDTVAKQAEKIQELEGKLAAGVKHEADAVAAKAQESMDQMETQRREANRLFTEVQEAKLTIDAQKKKIEELESTKGSGGTGGITGERPIRPDGKVSRVQEDAGICYVDLGKKDQVQPDVSFAVYAPASDVSGAKVKGKLLVKKVLDGASECRIVAQDKDDPIKVGDVVSNVAFDRVRGYRFLVRGRFDVYGTGRPKEEDAQAVKNMVRRFGGQVVDVLDPVQTDYVILGEAPEVPQAPLQSDPPEVWKVYQNNVKFEKEYRETQAQAQKMGIPVLSYSKFMDLTGYVPQETLKTE